MGWLDWIGLGLVGYGGVGSVRLKILDGHGWGTRKG